MKPWPTFLLEGSCSPLLGHLPPQSPWKMSASGHCSKEDPYILDAVGHGRTLQVWGMHAWTASCSYSRTCWAKCVSNQSPHSFILLSWYWIGHWKSTFYRKGWGKQLNLSLSSSQCFLTLGRLGASPPYIWTVQSLHGWKRGQNCKVKWLKRMVGITHGYQRVRAADGSVIFSHQ